MFLTHPRDSGLIDLDKVWTFHIGILKKKKKASYIILTCTQI